MKNLTSAQRDAIANPSLGDRIFNTDSGYFNVFTGARWVEEDENTGIRYSEKELVSFGNFLLTKERQKKVSKELRRHVTDADLCNWKAENQ